MCIEWKKCSGPKLLGCSARSSGKKCSSSKGVSLNKKWLQKFCLLETQQRQLDEFQNRSPIQSHQIDVQLTTTKKLIDFRTYLCLNHRLTSWWLEPSASIRWGPHPKYINTETQWRICNRELKYLSLQLVPLRYVKS